MSTIVTGLLPDASALPIGVAVRSRAGKLVTEVVELAETVNGDVVVVEPMSIVPAESR